MAKIVSLVQGGGSSRIIGVDEEGELWRGEITRDTSGEEFVQWKPLRSEFQRPR